MILNNVFFKRDYYKRCDVYDNKLYNVFKNLVKRNLLSDSLFQSMSFLIFIKYVFS